MNIFEFHAKFITENACEQYLKDKRMEEGIVLLFAFGIWFTI